MKPAHELLPSHVPVGRHVLFWLGASSKQEGGVRFRREERQEMFERLL